MIVEMYKRDPQFLKGVYVPNINYGPQDGYLDDRYVVGSWYSFWTKPEVKSGFAERSLRAAEQLIKREVARGIRQKITRDEVIERIEAHSAWKVIEAHSDAADEGLIDHSLGEMWPKNLPLRFERRRPVFADKFGW